MRKVLPFLVVGFLIIVALLGSLNYSLDTAIYECSGVMRTENEKTGNESHPTTLFIEITHYRWWAFWDPPLDGLLRLETPFTAQPIPTIPDDPSAARWFGTGNNSVRLAPPFPGLLFGPKPYAIRENLFGIIRLASHLYLYRWPKAGETVNLTEAGQGQFSTISNALGLKLSDEVTFGGSCKSKK
jgi:hypothetical protein